MKLQDYINREFESVDTTGIGNVKLNAEVLEFEIIRNDEDVKTFKVRFVGYDELTSHPDLRNPRTNGWFTLRFENDGEWFFYDYE